MRVSGKAGRQCGLVDGLFSNRRARGSPAAAHRGQEGDLILLGKRLLPRRVRPVVRGAHVGPVRRKSGMAASQLCPGVVDRRAVVQR